MTETTGERRAARTLFGVPRGALLVIAVEFWERFSFYSMLSILALFLTAPATQGGFGWSNGATLRLVGTYTGLMYALPVVGGLLADRLWGHRRAIAIGAGLMVAGHFLMAAPAAIPWLLGRAAGGPATDLAALGVPLGGWPAPATGAAGLAYRLVTLGFYGALACLVAGNAMMKSTLVIVLGDLFDQEDARRDGAYAYYYLSISLGALVAGLAAGWVALRFGWHFGFTMAGFGMVTALTLYLRLGPTWLAARAAGLPATAAKPRPGLGAAELRARIAILGVLAALLCVYEIGAFQLWGAWTLFIEHAVDRRVDGFVIPTPWFSALNSATVIPATPLIAALWLWLARRRSDLDIVQKYAIGLALGGACLALFAVAARAATAHGQALWVLPAAAVVITSLGEIVAWTSTYGAVYRLAPPGLVSASMGAFYAATMGLGGFLAGWLGQSAQSLGYASYFGGLAAATLAAAVLALAVRPMLQRWAFAGGASLRAGG